MFKVGQVVKTKNGYDLRILATDRPTSGPDPRPIVAMVLTSGAILTYQEGGRVTEGFHSGFDIDTRLPKSSLWLVAMRGYPQDGRHSYLTLLNDESFHRLQPEGNILNAVKVEYDPNENTFELLANNATTLTVVPEEEEE